MQVAEILKDRPSWYRDCRSVDIVNVLPTGSSGTIELLYMQVRAYSFAASGYSFSMNKNLALMVSKNFCCLREALCANHFGTSP